MTLNFDHDLDRIKANHQAKYLGHRSFSFKLSKHIDMHTKMMALPRQVKWSVTMSMQQQQPVHP